MPMAGEGKRFKDAGYELPKPLININDQPMFIESAKCMPKADLWIFIVRENLLNNDLVEKEIKKNFKDNKIISVKKKTEGQASTCFLAKEHLQKDDQIFISSCDNYFEIDQEDFKEKIKKYDILIFTTEAKNIHVEKPEQFGWVKKDHDGSIKVSCKKKISNNPIQDRIVVGSFFFKNLNFFKKSIEVLLKKKIKINDEYYLDMAIIEAIDLGFNVGEIIVKNYISWGSSEELKSWKNEIKK